MKRSLAAALCGSLVLVLAGCNIWDIIWQGVIGKGYYQTTQASIANNSAKMTNASIDLANLSTSSVIIYKTNARGLYGKLSLTTTPPAGSLKIMFVTYATDGTSLPVSGNYTISSGNSFDLESGSLTSPGTSDFLYSSGTLTPQNKAVFCINLP